MISHTSAIGKILRIPFKFIPKNMIITIIFGKLSRNKWIITSSIHRCWIGFYEYEKQILMSKIVKKGDIFFDIGANVGFFTLLAAKLVGECGKVFAFEPLPRNIEYLRKHIEMNNYKNVKIFDYAISDNSGITAFSESSHPGGAHIDANGTIYVKLSTLDKVVFNDRIPSPTHIKVDVEGYELNVLLGARELLKKYHPNIFMDVHHRDLFKECCSFLYSKGYTVRDMRMKSINNRDRGEIFAYKK